MSNSWLLIEKTILREVIMNMVKFVVIYVKENLVDFYKNMVTSYVYICSVIEMML